MLYAQSYNLTWVLVAFLVGSVLVSRGVVMWRRGKCSLFFSSQTHSIVSFAGRLLRWAWLRGSSPSSLIAGTCVGSGRLGRGSPWLNARTGRGKRSLLGFAVWDTGPVDEGEGACAYSVSWESFRERGWREAGESFWREARERELCTNVSPFVIVLG